MTYKFYDDGYSIEFTETPSGVIITTYLNNKQVSLVRLSKANLFELIGGLLRIQSKIKK